MHLDCLYAHGSVRHPAAFDCAMRRVAALLCSIALLTACGLADHPSSTPSTSASIVPTGADGTAASTGEPDTPECREPLTPAQCDAAVRDARAFVDANADLLADVVANRDVGAIRYSLVWTCGTDDATCHRDQPGLGWVRLVDANGHSPGAVVVCVEDSICAGQEPSGLQFP
jgi:hypothetical protein